jgi:hypothetical protein
MVDLQLTEGQAWRLIAVRLSNPEYRMDEGLCNEAQKLFRANQPGGPLINRTTRNSMILRVKGHVKQCHPEYGGWGFAFPPRTHRDERLLAALWLAEEADEDGLLYP